MNIPNLAPESPSKYLEKIGNHPGNSSSRFQRSSILPEREAFFDILFEIQEQNLSPEQECLLDLINTKEVDAAARMALNPEFIEKNRHFVESGVPMKAAIENDLIELVNELLLQDYKISPLLVAEEIKAKNKKAVTAIVENSYYTKEVAELTVWLLAAASYMNLAAQVLHKEGVTHSQNSRFSADPLVCAPAMAQALSLSQDDLACQILISCPSAVTMNMVTLGLEHNCMNFVKRLWSGNLKTADPTEIKAKSKQSTIWSVLSPGETDGSLRISTILRILLDKGNAEGVASVLNWPGAFDEGRVLPILIKYKQEELARNALNRGTEYATADDFMAAHSNELHTLCLDMLRFHETQSALQALQADLIPLLESGETCLVAMEMLSLLNKRAWDIEVTKELCTTLTTFAKKKDELIVCKKPLLFCVLTTEFLTKISETSLQYQTRCLSTAEIFTALGIRIENAIKDENELRHFLQQQDSRGRNVLTILSKNRMYTMLENDEIGTIVTKLWVGPKKNYGILGASTIANSFQSSSGSEEAMQFARRMDAEKPYMFHYEQWVESCSLRFIAQAISTFALVCIYQMVIYTAIANDTFYNVAANAESEQYLRIAQVWITGILLEQVLNILFGVKTGRGYQLDNWRVLDFLMFGLMITLMLELHDRFMGEGKLIEFIDPTLFNAGLHSTMMVLIWLKFMSVLITSKSFGPFLRMIYLMIGKVVNFFVIFLCLAFCSAAVFTSLFSSSSYKFADFSTSCRTLFSASIAAFDMEAFDDNVALGGVLLGVFLLISNVMLLNLLIALLSNVYSDLIVRVDSEHRAVVISYYNRFSWDKRCGFLIFLPSPLNYIVALFSPLVMCTKNSAKWNDRLSRAFYIFYALPQFVVFLVGSCMYMPLLYIKGFLIYAKTGYLKKAMKTRKVFSIEKASSSLDEQEEEGVMMGFNYWKSVLWFFIGVPWLLFALIRDCVDFWRLMYTDHVFQNEETEKTKVQQIVTPTFMQDVQRVLQGLKAPEVTVHQLLEAWLIFEELRTPSHEELINRKQLAYEYFIQLSNSTNDPIVNVVRMRRLLPYREGTNFSEEYLLEAQHINVPWIRKAVKRFQQKVGSVQVLQEAPGESERRLDMAQVEALENSVKDLQEKYASILAASKNIKHDMELQSKALKQLVHASV